MVAGVLDAAGDDVGPAAQALGGAVQLAAQVAQVGAADVGQLDVLGLLPHALVEGVEDGGAAGQLHEAQPRGCPSGEEGLDRRGEVDGAVPGAVATGIWRPKRDAARHGATAPRWRGTPETAGRRPTYDYEPSAMPLRAWVGVWFRDIVTPAVQPHRVPHQPVAERGGAGGHDVGEPAPVTKYLNSTVGAGNATPCAAAAAPRANCRLFAGEEPQRSTGRSVARDGRAALAVVLLAAVLIAGVINSFVERR
jgi:hypothetical protein